MPDSPDSYETLAAPASAEERIQRSRFVARAGPAASVKAAQTLVDAVRREFHDARHVCYAWRVGGAGETVEIRQDDGEPSGTAGEPILQAIRGADLQDTVVAVARYFGGVKLGTGGLARAYGGVAAAALASAPRRTVNLGRTFTLVLDYAQQKTVERLLADHGGHIEQSSYTDRVQWSLWLPLSACENFATALHEISHGQLTLPAPDDPA